MNPSPADRATSPKRTQVLGWVADRIPFSADADCVRVGIDGVDGAGKTTFADDLAAALRRRGRAVIRISVDDFHHPRAVRYRRGPNSPEGFWRDSFDYDRLRLDVLAPLGPGGSRRYRPASHDVTTDEVLHPACRIAPAGAVLVLDGLFLHRDELAEHWDVSIWLDAPLTVTVARLAARDGSSPDPEDPSLRRYIDAQRHYLSTCDPLARAQLVIDNSDPDSPQLVVRNHE